MSQQLKYSRKNILENIKENKKNKGYRKWVKHGITYNDSITHCWLSRFCLSAGTLKNSC